MCPNKDFLKTFESIDGGKVLLGNNVTCETNGIGTISFKMFDSVIKDLKQVRYMLDLKINLISLGMIALRHQMVKCRLLIRVLSS